METIGFLVAKQPGSGAEWTISSGTSSPCHHPPPPPHPPHTQVRSEFESLGGLHLSPKLWQNWMGLDASKIFFGMFFVGFFAGDGTRGHCEPAWPHPFGKNHSQAPPRNHCWPLVNKLHMLLCMSSGNPATTHLGCCFQRNENTPTFKGAPLKLG